MTPTQQSIVNELTEQYGKPDLIAYNTGNYLLHEGVVVRLTWWEQRRQLFILPNGDRLAWWVI